jgi:hypothetical protein
MHTLLTAKGTRESRDSRMNECCPLAYNVHMVSYLEAHVLIQSDDALNVQGPCCRLEGARALTLVMAFGAQSMRE